MNYCSIVNVQLQQQNLIFQNPNFKNPNKLACELLNQENKTLEDVFDEVMMLSDKMS
jgi:hypothetical protein